MISLVSLLVAAALVSQQYGFEANALIDVDSLNVMDNNLVANDIPLPAPKRPRRVIRPYVKIDLAPPKSLERVAGEKIALKCVAMGNPAPSIYWMKNGQTVEDPSEEVNEILPPGVISFGTLSSTLIIDTLTQGEDEYTCVAEAGVNRATSTTIVYTVEAADEDKDLLALQKLFLSSPLITYYYTDIFQKMSSTTVLPCRANSITRAKVFWQDNKDDLIHGHSRIKVLSSGDLLISSLSWEDMGNFTCIAKNAYGEDSVRTFIYPMKP